METGKDILRVVWLSKLYQLGFLFVFRGKLIVTGITWITTSDFGCEVWHPFEELVWDFQIEKAVVSIFRFVEFFLVTFSPFLNWVVDQDTQSVKWKMILSSCSPVFARYFCLAFILGGYGIISSSHLSFFVRFRRRKLWLRFEFACVSSRELSSCGGRVVFRLWITGLGSNGSYGCECSCVLWVVCPCIVVGPSRSWELLEIALSEEFSKYHTSVRCFLLISRHSLYVVVGGFAWIWRL